MARRIKSLAHNVKDASPYEPWHTKLSPYHREHRSKRGRCYKPNYNSVLAYRKRLEEIKKEELENEQSSITI